VGSAGAGVPRLRLRPGGSFRAPGVARHEWVAGWVTADPWWDTCDSLARHSAGMLVSRHPALRSTMDRWLAGPDVWLARAAIIHMGAWKEAIDRDWVFAACLSRAEDQEFFIRKAIGWILRDLAWVDGPAVVAFLDGPGAGLSKVSKTEALKSLRGARAAARLRQASRRQMA